MDFCQLYLVPKALFLSSNWYVIKHVYYLSLHTKECLKSFMKMGTEMEEQE